MRIVSVVSIHFHHIFNIFFFSRNAGVITEARAKQNLVGEAMDRARAELDGRTGETDSELEMEPDEEPVGPGEGPGEQPDDVMNI